MLQTIKSYICYFILSQSFLNTLQAQNAYPEIGKRCPDFLLTDVRYSSKNRLSLDDLRGKFFILDFWDKFCGACVESFPHTSEIQRQFKDSLKIILIGNSRVTGPYAKGQDIHALYERYREYEKLNLVVAYDSTVSERFVPASNPHLIWVDDKGIIQAITASGLSVENVNAFLNNRPFDFVDHSYKAGQKRASYSNQKLLFINGNGGNDTAFLMRSLFSKSNFNATSKHVPYGTGAYYTVDAGHKALIQFACVEPIFLYKDAYTGIVLTGFDDSTYGKFYNGVIIEMKDPKDSIKCRSILYDSTYNYSLCFPIDRASSRYVRRILRNDLDNFFEYDVKVEERAVPVWKLIVIDKEKVDRHRTKGDTPPILPLPHSMQNKNIFEKSERTAIYFKNAPANYIVRLLCNTFDVSLYDSTELDFNVDLRIDAIRTDRAAVRRELQKYGFDIVYGTKVLKTMVFRIIGE